MSIKGTSVEVIVVLVVFPPPLYGTGQISISPLKGWWLKIYLSPLTGRIKKSIVSKINSTKFIPSFSRTSTKNNDRFYQDIIDWFQGRFSGQTMRIIVREGKIIEKVFVSPKGNKISVKRSKLEERIRSIPTVQIKLRLRIRSIPLIKCNSRL